MSSIRERLGASFWLLPALFAAGAGVLFVLTQYLDQRLQTSVAGMPVFFSGGATAARSVLSTIAGSLITVMATVFSITMVTLQLASSSYSPRLLRNFTSDRGVQAVLGAYIATFLYSLLVLRIIRAPESEGAQFNPVVSVTVAVVLALVCVGLLIYFIAHVMNLIQSSTIVGRAHADTMEAVARLDDLRNGPEEPDPPRPSEPPAVVHAKESGYVQRLDVGEILRVLARGGGAFAEVPFGPGSFVSAGLPVVRIWPVRRLEGRDAAELLGAFGLGEERSFRQDFAFGLRQLADIALKGLSPGVNDPTTAMQAMDRIEAVFVALGGKSMPTRTLRAGGGAEVVVRVGHYGFEDVTGLAFDQVRRAAFTSGQVAVLERLVEILGRAVLANRPTERRRFLWNRLLAVARLAPEQVSDPRDANNLVLRVVEAARPLARTPLAGEVLADLDGLAESSGRLPGGGEVREAVEDFRARAKGRRGPGEAAERTRTGEDGSG